MVGCLHRLTDCFLSLMAWFVKNYLHCVQYNSRPLSSRKWLVDGVSLLRGKNSISPIVNIQLLYLSTCISDINSWKIWKAQNGDWEMVRKKETASLRTDVFQCYRLGLFLHICTLYLIWASPDWLPLWSTVSTQGSNFVSISENCAGFLIAAPFSSSFHWAAMGWLLSFFLE